MSKKVKQEPTQADDNTQAHETTLTPSIRASVVVQAVSFEENVNDEQLEAKIKSQRVIDYQVDVLPIEAELQDSFVDTGHSSSPTKFKKLIWLLATILVITLSIAELYSAVSLVFTQHNWLTGGWLVLFGLLLFVLLGFGSSELRSLKRLKKQGDVQQQSLDLFNTPAIGLGQMHCESIARQLPKYYQPLVKEWRDGLHSHYTNTEVLSLFELKVLSPIDKIALNKITTNASAAGVMIAVSPFAMLDMLIVLWRNIKMINQLSRLYGVPLGYWSRIALIKKIFRSMLYAGAMEILSDAGNYALGVGLTGKISTRVAQGLGAGVLTSRIGLKALNECRPMPWLSVSKPGLTHMTNQLMEDLRKYIK